MRARSHGAHLAVALAMAGLHAAAFAQAVNGEAKAVASKPATGAQRAARKRVELLLVDLKVNGQRMPDVVQIERADDGKLLMAKSGWIEARLVLPPTPRTLSDGADAYALDAVAGLVYRLDRNALSLEIDAPAVAFTVSTLDAQLRGTAPSTPPDPGLMLNYDLSVLRGRGDEGVSGGAFFEAISFSRWGSFVASGVLTADRDQRRFERLDTYWRYDMPERAETIVAGDTVGAGAAWSRPVRYGGLRWSRDFGMRPGFITMPQLTLSGQAALPSTVDVLVNNARRASQSVAPGPFDLPNIPLSTGAGEVGLLLRDVLGRETLVQQSYYASPRLLAPGLVDFSAEAGRIRTGYGRDSHYGDGFAAGTVRTGLNSWITGEARGELQAGRRAAGVEVAGLLGTWAVARISVAASTSDLQGFPERGHTVQAGIERVTSRSNASLQYEHSTRGFAPFGETIDAASAPQRTRDRWLGAVGGQIAGNLSGGVNLLRETRWDGDKLTSLGLSLNKPAGGQATIGLYVNKRFDTDRSWSAALIYTVPLESGAFATARVQRESDGHWLGEFSASMNAPAGPGLGWRVDASTEPSQRARGGVQLNTNNAELTAEASADARGDVALRAGARGTIGLLGGVPFASRPVGDRSIAVVEVEGLEGVPVWRSNQRVATTDSRGLAFIPALLPWQSNKLEIDPADLPIDVELGETVRDVVPYARSGIVVKFPMRRTLQAVLVLHQPSGKPVPERAIVKLEDGAEFIVGRRGEAWITGLTQSHQSITVSWATGRCAIVFDLPAASDAGPAKIGPLVCKSDAEGEW